MTSLGFIGHDQLVSDALVVALAMIVQNELTNPLAQRTLPKEDHPVQARFLDAAYEPLFTVEVWTRRGLQRFIVLFLIDLSTQKVEIPGIAQAANGLWMSQIARNLTDLEEAILIGKRYLIHDRDPLFTAEFLNMITDAGVKSVKLPPRSPNLNAYAERFVRTSKESCLNHMIFFGEESLRAAIQNLVAHYDRERNHQGLANQLISPEAGHLGSAGEVQRRQRLSGMLNYYYRDAA